VWVGAVLLQLLGAERHCHCNFYGRVCARAMTGDSVAIAIAGPYIFELLLQFLEDSAH
jgi:hypothetical protein